MNVSVSHSSWHGHEALVLESDHVRTVVLPELGAKIVSLLDKRAKCEWLIGPGTRPLDKVDYGAVFVDQDMSGWDEMFPTVVACDYPVPGEKFGATLPDHGEVWPLAWRPGPGDADEICLSVMGRALHYRLSRTLSFSAPDTLQLEYEVENLSHETMPYLWAAHPQFDSGGELEIILPDEVKAVCNVLPAEWGWGQPETRAAWPQAVNSHGLSQAINHVGPRTLKSARKFFVLPESPVGWAGLIRRPGQAWLRLEWDPDLVPYLGIWVDEGRISDESVVALEPMTGFYDSLAIAWDKGLVSAVEPGATQTWSLFMTVGTGQQPFPAKSGRQ
jgi:galactose mutarotase-like enzyme